jgi:hypothetical protein
MRRIHHLLCLAALLTACGGGSDTGGEGQPCGPNGECAPGLVCDPINNTCVRRGSGMADAGVFSGPPVVVISSPAIGATTCATTIVSFDTDPSNDGVTYTCKLDDQDPAPCAEPSVSYTGLAAGDHTVTIHAVDESDNATDKDISFTVDAIGPDVVLGAANAGGINTGTATVTFTGDSTIAGAVGAISLQRPQADPVAVPCTCTASSCSCVALAAGENNIVIAGTDSCGNTGNVLDLTVSADFGPNDGHAVLIGDRFDTDSTPSVLLANAVTLAPVSHRNLSSRGLRVLGWTGALATDDPGRVNALAALEASVPGFAADDPVAYVETGDEGEVLGLLPGRDVLLVFDQGSAMDSATLDGIADTWRGQLQTFLEAGGVVVVLNGVYDGEGPIASDTWRVLGGGRAGLVNVSAQAVELGEGDPTVTPTYPAETLGTTPFWLARGTSGWTGTGSNACLFPNDPSATEIFTNLSRFCGDGCNYSSCPVVLDKVFAPYAMSIAFTQPPGAIQQNRTGLVGQGTFTVPSVAHSGFRCAFEPVPSSQQDPTPPLACTVPSEGNFSFDVRPNGGGDYLARLTLLDATGEPARSASGQWIVDDIIFVSGSPTQIDNTTAPSFYVCEYGIGPNGCAAFKSSTCFLERDDGSGTFQQVGPTRTDAACGATADPAGGWLSGDRIVSWAAVIRATGPGRYRATLTADDFYGNTDRWSTVWNFGS